MGGKLAYVFLIVLILAVIGIFRPYKFIKGGKRWHYGVAAALAFILIGLTAPQIEEKPAPEIDTVKPKAAAVAALPDDEAVKASMIAFGRNLYTAMSPCDQTGKALAAAAQGMTNGTASVYEVYDAAKEANEGCAESSTNIGKVTVPDNLPDDVQKSAKATIRICETASLSKMRAASTMMEIADGDGRPSKVTEMREEAERGQTALLACVAELFVTGDMVGVKAQELKP